MSLAQLQRLLPLPEEDLQQMLDYAATLSKQEAVEHFNSVLGESPQALEFISSFNSRRKDVTGTSEPAPPSSSSTSEVPKPHRASQKKKGALHALPARQIANTYEAQGRAYVKDDGQDYITRRAAGTPPPPPLQRQPDAVQAPLPRAPPSAAGRLISDPKKHPSRSTPNTSRNSSPAPKKSTKVSITGGMPMQGASTALGALDAAIRSLELATNPTRQSTESRACNCIAARHALLAAAPNCLACGKVICVKEGLGPCTFCGAPLLSGPQIQGMLRALKDERGRERMALDATTRQQRRTDVPAAPFSNPRAGGPTPAEQSGGPLLPPAAAAAAMQQAQQHRDRLLGFQAQNARRTTVRDEVSDFETPDAGTSMWASVEERAAQLRHQQAVLREQQWNARPEYERRREVVSIDLQGRRVVRRLENVDRPTDVDETEADAGADEGGDTLLPLTASSGNRGGSASGSGTGTGAGTGTFGRNPLLAGLIKPVYHPSGKGKEVGMDEPRKTAWRRVQDDYDDNEGVILDGGVYGGHETLDGMADEPARG
ncbi:MAG: hypothetical protein M1818_007740 [Claussenomyces sp. TS43310]|nr:MAG: hypothetical protein M1818_007740 [Claussenomyces sp. TS43310]